MAGSIVDACRGVGMPYSCILYPTAFRLPSIFALQSRFSPKERSPPGLREGIFLRILQSLFSAGYQEDGAGDGEKQGKHQVGSLAAGHTGGVYIIKCNGPENGPHQPHRILEQPKKCEEHQRSGALHQSGNAKLFPKDDVACVLQELGQKPEIRSNDPCPKQKLPQRGPAGPSACCGSAHGPGTDTGPKDCPGSSPGPRAATPANDAADPAAGPWSGRRCPPGPSDTQKSAQWPPSKGVPRFRLFHSLAVLREYGPPGRHPQFLLPAAEQ